MTGLDMVKGPHWSQILSLFGANGSISDILKERTQVQLKDKARNLKLFFLKTNSEMPYYLSNVTGELKTRAPSTAARKEAEEKARMNSEEEQARIQGIMTLAGGLQNKHIHMNSPGPVSTLARGSPLVSGTAGAGGSASMLSGTANIAPAPLVPISPLVKTEPVEHHGLPQIKPALSPGSQQAQTDARSQGLSHIQQHRQPPPPLQPHPKPQLHHSQPTPASLLQASRSQKPFLPPTSQPQVQTGAPASVPAPTTASPQITDPLRPAGVQEPANHPFNGLPRAGSISHVSPDHAEEAKLFESLQAAVAAQSNSATDSHVPVAISEASVG
jgi:protein TBF1